MESPANRIAQSSIYHSYLVRLWQDNPHGPWRAMAQSVQSGESVRFADLTSLFAFLQAQTLTVCNPGDTAKEISSLSC